MQFSRNRCNIAIGNFPDISFPVNTPIGSVDVTVSKIGGGNGYFFPLSGQIVMPLSFLFHYDTRWADDDRADMTLTTANSISQRGTFNLTGMRFTSTNNRPIDDCGSNLNGTVITCSVTLVGTTVFKDGFLGGNEGGFTATGNIVARHPPPPMTRAECLTICQEIFDECVTESGPGAPTRARCNQRRTQCKNRCPTR